MNFAAFLWILLTCIPNAYSITDAEQFRRLRGQNIQCGGLTKLLRQSDVTRIDAGDNLRNKGSIREQKPDQVQPWAVMVLKNVIPRSPDQKNVGWSSSSGSLITENSILTCGSCLCNTNIDDDPTCRIYRSCCEIYCDEPCDTTLDQNQKNVNEIHIRLGEDVSKKKNSKNMILI